MSRLAFMMVLIALGCGDKESTPIDGGSPDSDQDTSTDTSDTTDTTKESAPCEVAVVETDPLDGNTNWYYRDTIQVVFSDPAADMASFTTTESRTGDSVDVIVTWDDTGFVASLSGPSGDWAGQTSYTVDVSVCDSNTLMSFETTEYGTSLNENPQSLVGNTYNFDMSAVTYLAPPMIGPVMSLYLSTPLLIGVIDADDTSITIVGAQGYTDEISGEVLQDPTIATWDFGTADFQDSPFFAASGQTVFEYLGYEIPIHDFSFEGTFSPDGTSIGGGVFVGLGDTTDMGPLLQVGSEPDATCNELATFGVECEPCPNDSADDTPLCLTVVGVFEEGELLDFSVDIIK